MANIPRVLKHLRAEGKHEGAGQFGLFGTPDTDELKLVELPEFSLAQRLDDERRLLGGFFSGHPVTSFVAALDKRTHTCSQRGAMEAAGTSARIVVIGLVRSFHSFGYRGVLEIEDETGPMMVSVGSKEQGRYQWILQRDLILAMRVTPHYGTDRTTLDLKEAKKVGEFKAEKPGRFKPKARR